MRIIALSGGLGNQMFQYAFFLTLKKRYRYVFFSTRKIHKRKEHNGYELNRLFGVQSFFSEILLNIPMLGWILYYVLFPQKYKEGKCYFFSGNSDVFDAKYSKTRYTGYWQSEKFFKDAEEDVRNVFKFNKEKLNKQTRDFLDVIKRTPYSVSLHVRRGDYVSPLGEDGPPSIFGNVCTDYYYTEARRRILERFPHAVFFIFSDDTNWCKVHFPSDANIVNWNTGKDSWQDMFLMSCCRHHITANSSFSWWGAYLGQHDDTVTITPRKWMNNKDTPDIAPDSWIKIDSQFTK